MAVILGGCCLAFAGSLSAQEKGNKSRPNFIFFLTDDQGWQDLECSGHPYLKTPNMDRLARSGTRFEQFYSAGSVCSASRAAFMTGHYPAKLGIHQHFVRDHKGNAGRNMPDWLDPKVETVTGLLKKAGYRTGHFGKWHLGHVNGAPELGEYGIDEYRQILGMGPGWKQNGEPADYDVALRSYAGRTRSPEKDYFWTHSADVMVDEAIAFLEKNDGQPFYLNLWTILPHAPNRPTAEQLAVYKDLKVDPEDFQSWMRDYITDSPNDHQQMKTYCAVVTHIDVALGRLLDKLDELSLADDTVILFTSDNGPEDWHMGEVRHSGVGSTGVLRGRKRSLYEGGIRMPCIVRWPGKVPAGRVDKTSVIGAVDWLPTVCSLAGVTMPSSGQGSTGRLDGEDVTDILKGKSRPRQRPLFWEWRGGVHGYKGYRPPGLAIRQDQWKLFSNPDGQRIELYNIPEDPAEKTNVAEQNPDVVARLLPKLLEWKATLP